MKKLNLFLLVFVMALSLFITPAVLSAHDDERGFLAIELTGRYFEVPGDWVTGWGVVENKQSLNPRYSAGLFSPNGLVEVGYYRESGEILFSNGYKIRRFHHFDLKVMGGGSIDRNKNINVFVGIGVDGTIFDNPTKYSNGSESMMSIMIPSKMIYDIDKRFSLFINLNLSFPTNSIADPLTTEGTNQSVEVWSSKINFGVGLLIKFGEK